VARNGLGLEHHVPHPRGGMDCIDVSVLYARNKFAPAVWVRRLDQSCSSEAGCYALVHHKKMP
jgi:hypothetical protein